jgi:glycerophosphoryl diester phosphodiesterase
MRIFHLRARFFKKHLENSIRGIRKAVRLGYDAIDLDLLITKDGVIVVCHWDRPLLKDGFVDPNHRIQVRALVRALTWAQIETLRAPGGYRIIRIEHALAECARDRIIAYLEPKDDPRFALDSVWQYIKSISDLHRTKVRVYALPQNKAALPPARRVGYRTRLIRRAA